MSSAVIVVRRTTSVMPALERRGGRERDLRGPQRDRVVGGADRHASMSTYVAAALLVARGDRPWRDELGPGRGRPVAHEPLPGLDHRPRGTRLLEGEHREVGGDRRVERAGAQRRVVGAGGPPVALVGGRRDRDPERPERRPGGQCRRTRWISLCIGLYCMRHGVSRRGGRRRQGIRGPSCCGCSPGTPRSRSCTSPPTPTPARRSADSIRRSSPAYGDLRFSPYDAADLSGLDLVFTALPHGASQLLIPELLETCRARRRPRCRLPVAGRRVPAVVRRAARRARAHRSLRVRARRALPRRRSRPRARRGARLLSDRGEPRVRAAARGAARRAARHHRRRGVGRVRRGPGPEDDEPVLRSERERAARTGCSRTATPRRWSRRCRTSRGAPVEVLFTPHLVPTTRGILATCYARPARRRACRRRGCSSSTASSTRTIRASSSSTIRRAPRRRTAPTSCTSPSATTRAPRPCSRSRPRTTS